MKILSAQGIKDFVVCTGYKSEYIANYFANYGASSKDFTVNLGDESSIVYHGDHEELDWTVTVAYTGADTMTSGRIKRAQKYIGDEPFLCTYGDGIANVDVVALQEFHRQHGRLATMTTTRPYSRFGVIDIQEDGSVAKFRRSLRPTTGSTSATSSSSPASSTTSVRTACLSRSGPCTPSPTRASSPRSATTGSGSPWTRTASHRCSTTCGRRVRLEDLGRRSRPGRRPLPDAADRVNDGPESPTR